MALPKPIRIRGVDYPSVIAAAKSKGVHPMTVYKAISEGRLDFCGLGSNKPKPVTVDGVEYPSIQKAARATGINFHTIRRAALK